MDGSVVTSKPEPWLRCLPNARAQRKKLGAIGDEITVGKHVSYLRPG